MQAHGREAAGGLAYARHRPEETRLYRLVEQHYPAFVASLAEQGKVLPAYVEREFEAYLKCGRLEHGFLRVRCESCHFERLVAFSCKKRGFCPSCGARRMAETAAPGTGLTNLSVAPAGLRCCRIMFSVFLVCQKDEYRIRIVLKQRPKISVFQIVLVDRYIVYHHDALRFSFTKPIF